MTVVLLCYSAVQRIAVCCNVLQCVAVCGIMQGVVVCYIIPGVAGVLQVCCSVLQCVAVCYRCVEGEYSVYQAC